ncbi:ATP-binding domain-containing protein [Actinoplanes sp. LDG1-06]|uniref:ATP-binding domain-containing protein n=1 Tax=Paractinoplanes ovalisporus TaxID=2810368 RepID=A0ABS2AGC2_9ACTN|nr:ATP-binding domain-containing protein [Actinoplanes ovalisporus]
MRRSATDREVNSLRPATIHRRQPPANGTGRPVVSVSDVRGREIDTVLVIAPHRFAEPRDLYVAMTRATRCLYLIELLEA